MSENYDAYMIRRAGEKTCAMIGGQFRWIGNYWNRAAQGWEDYTRPRDIFTNADRATFTLPTGGEWVGIFIENGGR